MTSVPLHTQRPRLTNHRRLSRSLRTLSLDHPTIAKRRDIWGPLVDGRASEHAPLAVQGVPAAQRAVDANRAITFWPATIFPHGFRQQVLAHCGYETDPAPEVSLVGAAVRAHHASILNLQGRYWHTVEIYGQHSQNRAQLHYEVARSVYQVDPGNHRAVKVFADLSSRGPSEPWLSLNGYARMIAHLVRQTGELDVCESWKCNGLDTAERSLMANGGYGAILGASRVHRAVALWAARNRDLDLTSKHLRASEALNAKLTTTSVCELDRIMQLQDERLIYEASSKAYVTTGQCLTNRPQDEVVRRLVEIDPCDPYIRLICGEAMWVMERDDEAIEHFEEASLLGTLVGAHAASRLAVIWRWAGHSARSAGWLEVTDELDPGFAGGPDDWRN